MLIMAASSYANNHAGKVTDLQDLQGIPQTADKAHLSIDLNRHKPSCANLNWNPPDLCLYISSHHPLSIFEKVNDHLVSFLLRIRKEMQLGRGLIHSHTLSL